MWFIEALNAQIKQMDKQVATFNAIENPGNQEMHSQTKRDLMTKKYAITTALQEVQNAKDSFGLILNIFCRECICKECMPNFSAVHMQQ